jgi:hypothetical protein
MGAGQSRLRAAQPALPPLRPDIARPHRLARSHRRSGSGLQPVAVAPEPQRPNLLRRLADPVAVTGTFPQGPHGWFETLGVNAVIRGTGVASAGRYHHDASFGACAAKERSGRHRWFCGRRSLELRSEAALSLSDGL